MVLWTDDPGLPAISKLVELLPITDSAIRTLDFQLIPLRPIAHVMHPYGCKHTRA